MVLEVSRNESGVHQLVDSELHIFGGVDKIAVSLDTNILLVLLIYSLVI